MQKHLLAKELRERQYKAGRVEKSVIDTLSDDEIIGSYITCSHCGEKIADTDLRTAIALANDSTHFLDLCVRFQR